MHQLYLEFNMATTINDFTGRILRKKHLSKPYINFRNELERLDK
jgi:hypothetical protein